jgi:DNA-binding protein HU-beta
MPPQFAKAAAAKKAGAKKATPAKKVGAKKANPFAKTMSAPCPPGSMSGGMGTSTGLGAAKKVTKAAKVAVAKKAPKAMGEVGTTSRAVKNAITAKTRQSRKLPSQGRINPSVTGKGGKNTTGSDVN